MCKFALILYERKRISKTFDVNARFGVYSKSNGLDNGWCPTYWIYRKSRDEVVKRPQVAAVGPRERRMHGRPVGAEDMNATTVTLGCRRPQCEGDAPSCQLGFEDKTVGAFKSGITIARYCSDRLQGPDRLEDRLCLTADRHTASTQGKRCDDLRLTHV